jgi:hypothetical protein
VIIELGQSTSIEDRAPGLFATEPFGEGQLRKLEQQVKSVYARRGIADCFAVHLAAGDHTYTEEMFKQVSEWFQRFLKK